MKVIVAGSRDFCDLSLVKEAFKDLEGVTEIISGGANGADSLGEIYAENNDIKLTVMNADWDQYGKGAGHIRNGQMAEYGDMAVIFWDSVSKGTENMIKQMKKFKKPCVIIRYTENDLEEW